LAVVVVSIQLALITPMKQLRSMALVAAYGWVYSELRVVTHGIKGDLTLYLSGAGLDLEQWTFSVFPKVFWK
jgi:hypothetical protein